LKVDTLQTGGGQPLALKVRRVAGAPVVAVRLVLRGGARGEELPGQALVAGRLLAEGTEARDWRQLAEAVEDRGMVLASSGTFEAHGVAVNALATDWRLALEWAAELVLQPAFDPERHALVARQAAAELESLADQPDVRTGWAFLRQLYGSHPLGRPLQGNPESLAALTPEQCAAFHQRGVGAGGVVAVAGAVDEEEVLGACREIFGPFRGLAAPAPPVVALEDVPDPGVQRVELPGGDQAHLFLGHLTLPRGHEDAPSLGVLAVILGAGAGLTGRIPLRVREREGLAYSTHAQTMAGAGLDPGRLVAYAGTSAASVERAERAMREEITRLVQEGVTDAEVEEARAYLLGREPFRWETARQWAEAMAEAAFYDLPLDDPEWRLERLRRIDRQRVESVARRLLRPEALRVTIGVPAT
jgi:predicted Zn-dependent peptidase